MVSVPSNTVVGGLSNLAWQRPDGEMNLRLVAGNSPPQAKVGSVQGCQIIMTTTSIGWEASQLSRGALIFRQSPCYSIKNAYTLGTIWIWTVQMAHRMDMGRRGNGVLSGHGLKQCIAGYGLQRWVQSGDGLKRLGTDWICHGIPNGRVDINPEFFKIKN